MLNEVHNIIKMIELVKNRPPLYDLTSYEHHYYNRANVDSLWHEIAAEIGTTPTECRKKWANLRNAFSRDLRIEKKAAQEQRPKKKWYLADHLEFLKIHLNTRYKTLNYGGQAQEAVDEDPKDFTMEENTNYFDLSTQDNINEYLTQEEIDELGTKNYFKSDNFSSVVVESPQIQKQQSVFDPAPALAPAPAPALSSTSTSSATSPLPLDIKIENSNTSHNIAKLPQRSSPDIRPRLNGNTSISLPKQQQMPVAKPYPQTSCPNAIKQRQTSEPTPCTNGIISKDEVQPSVQLDDRNMTFFKSIIPDILRLSDRKQRLYKQNVIMKLNKFLDEQEA